MQYKELVDLIYLYLRVLDVLADVLDILSIQEWSNNK